MERSSLSVAGAVLPSAGVATPGPSLPYTHGASSIERERLARRTAEVSAAFLLPHLRPGMRILDCGCGGGTITLGLAEAVAPGEAVGLDFQPAQVAGARALAAERGVANVRFVTGSVYELPFPDASFDAAYANTLFMHLAEPSRALAEMRRVLRPGGVIALADDDHDSFIWEPRIPLMTAWHHLVMRVIEHHGGDLRRSRHHRRLLQQGGFARPVAGATLGGGGVWGTPEETRLIAAWAAEQLRQPGFVQLVTEQGWADQSALDAIAAAVLAWGDQPDALLAVMALTALGWVDG
jgi:ubiquinone/menaquinone biosynthesis C-methylase UbiE